MQYVVAWRPLAAIQKNAGDSFGATLTFQHRGPAEQVWVGIGIAYGKSASTAGILLIGLIAIIDSLGHHPPFCWAMKQVSLNADSDLTTYTVDVDDKIPADMQSGQPLDAQKFISKTQPVVGKVAPDDFHINNWDDDVFTPPSATSISDMLGTMMPMLMMVMMMGMIMPLLGEETPGEKQAAPVAAKEVKPVPATPALAPAAKTGGVVINITE